MDLRVPLAPNASCSVLDRWIEQGWGFAEAFPSYTSWFGE